MNALVPIVVVLVGWRLNKRLKTLEQANWANQKLVERRLQLFDDIMPRLNDMYCFYNFVGNWKEITPADVISTKRYLDKKVQVYAAILGRTFVNTYEAFNKVAFKTYSDAGTDAKIRSVISGFDGDRKSHCRYEWDQQWDTLFLTPAVYDKTAFQASYRAVEDEFQRTIGITFPSVGAAVA